MVPSIIHPKMLPLAGKISQHHSRHHMTPRPFLNAGGPPAGPKCPLMHDNLEGACHRRQRRHTRHGHRDANTPCSVSHSQSSFSLEADLAGLAEKWPWTCSPQAVAYGARGPGICDIGALLSERSHHTTMHSESPSWISPSLAKLGCLSRQ